MRKITTCLMIGIVLWSIPVIAEWQVQDSHTFDTHVKAIWVCNEQSVYVGTTYGHLYHWNSHSWKEITCPSEGTINQIQGVDDTLFAVFDHDQIHWYDNGTWDSIQFPTEGLDCAIAGNTREHFYISTDNEIRQYRNGQWEIIIEDHQIPLRDSSFIGVYCTEENDLFVSVCTYHCDWVTNPYGTFWFCQPLPASVLYWNGTELEPFHNVSHSEEGILIPSCSTEDIYLYKNGSFLPWLEDPGLIHYNGVFYTEVATSPTYFPKALGRIQTPHLMFLSDQGHILVWDGLIPKKLPYPPDDGVLSSCIDGISKEDIWFSGSTFSVHHWVGPVPEVPAETGAFMKLHDYRIHTGEPFHLELAACNATDETLSGNVYCCMMLFGTNGLWFWPNWTKDPALIEPVTVTLEPNSIQYFDVFDFTWSEIDFQVDGLFHSIMVIETGEMTEFQSIGFSIR